jgi:subtilisin family serine protease
VNSQGLSQTRRTLLAAVLILLHFGAAGQTKQIRLRNETITTTPVARVIANARLQAQGLSAQTPISGLFLVQFEGQLEPAERAELHTLGVELLKYVPDDAFIARFQNVSPAEIQALSFVKWTGPYEPEYKLHHALQSKQAQAAARAVSATMNVSVVLAPRLSAGEIADAKKPFASIQQQTTLRLGTVLRGKINAAQLDALAKSDAVLWIEPAPNMKLFDEVSSDIVAGEGPPGQLYTQSLGYDGSGVNVAVADSGLNNGDAETMHPDLSGRATNFMYYGSLTDAADEHGHGTHVAGIIAGNAATGETDEDGYLYGLGVAPGANIIAQRIFDGVGNYEAPPSYETLTRDAKRAGADIGSNSWGDDTQGRYDVSAMEFDALVRDADALAFGDQPYILEFSAGNAGPGAQTIGSPAVAKNVIATGASESAREDLYIYSDGPDAMADFSSRGPCEDGRIKPDVVAPGTWIASLKSESATDENAWSPIDDWYFYMGGTSQAGPHVSGAAAVFVQYYRETVTNTTPSPALVKAALINSAVDMDDDYGTDPTPNMDEGWGRVDLTQLIGSTRRCDFVDQTALLQTSQVYERRVIVADSDDSLKITLAYTDVPGFPGAIPALVNDLDLEVVAPDGTIYRGNQFDGGESIPNAANADRVNNVEAVNLASPLPGEYIIRVRAHNVAEDARVDTGETDQDFALVTSGDLAPPGLGVVAMDKKFYRAPDRIKIFVADTDLAGNPSVGVTVRSTTEFSGENLTLLAAGTSGVFTGAIATTIGPATPDGTLQIANGDLIEALYFDASSSTTRAATAHADLVAPVLTGVAATNDFGQAIISWTSDEPATSIVRYGTNLASLTLGVTDFTLTTDHSLSIGGLVSGRTFYFYVISADAAGNAGTNNNGGSMYSFVAAPTAAILLVDEYQDPYGLGIPPLSGYTDPLDALGVSYDVWRTSSRGSPKNVLKSYRAVFWRVSDFAAPWTAAEKTAISTYLNSGGSLFVASMEVLTEVNDSAFVQNVLQVQSFVDDEHGSTGAPEIIGAPNEPVGKNLDIIMDYSVYSDLWSIYVEYGLFPDPPDLSDTITPSANASPVLRNDSGDIVGLRWPGVGQQAPGRLVLCTFPLDAVPMGSGANDRINFVRNVLSFLAPGLRGVGTVTLDSPAYSLPGLATVEVGDSDLAGNGTVAVTASSTTEPGGVSVTLYETTTPGVFDGSFQIISATNPATAGKVRARDGDTITVEYHDASSGSQVSATATVDTSAPVISGVDAEPDYEQAVISWDTSEPADTLVQFGESSFLGHTAYNAALNTSHEATLAGLAPDRLYYYRVVSRDAAGNTAVDDNGGALYRFSTLTPLSPPWADNMDSGASDWIVQTNDDSEVGWTRGVPHNGAETSAHSPPDAWGSNLNGDVIDTAESFLISPAIELTGGNTATLTFWHRYDFTDGESDYDIYEYGDLLVVTNNGVDSVVVAEYTGLSGGWTQEQVDLTPFIGHVIYLVWDYEMFSLDTRVRPGWLVDDVSITVSNVTPGTIQITKNLWQPPYILTGPLFKTGKAHDTLITNAPPGRYIVNFGDAPYYQTPAPQTNMLASGSNIVFQGDYTFVDTNTNGISDAWEMAYFGSVATNRTQLTDTDGDGMTDYAEFIAGTNPTNAASKLVFLSVTVQSNRFVQMQWAAVPGRVYQVESSTNFAGWTPLTDWLQASGSPMSYTATNFDFGRYAHMFRVQVRP